MKRSLPIIAALCITALSAATTAAARAPQPLTAAAVRASHLSRIVHPDLPAAARAAVKAARVRSVANWEYTFEFAGQAYLEHAVGKSIFSNGGTTVVNVPIVPVRLRFPAYVDPQTGQPPEIDATGDVARVLASPVFAQSPYSTGFTQYQDAAQRASFYSYYADSWHTLLAPHVLPTVTIDVPEDKGYLYYFIDTGTLLSEIDVDWWNAQQRIVAAGAATVEQLPIVLTRNTAAYFGDPDSGCCVGAWHNAWISDVRGITYFIQTSIWADWESEDFGDFADVYTLSHEVAEWMNDPFGVNFVPRWDFPQGPGFYYAPGECATVFETTLLEVADPLELSEFFHPVALNGFTYHLAEQATASWFSRDAPSSALHGAYSFPDESLLSGPAQDCP